MNINSNEKNYNTKIYTWDEIVKIRNNDFKLINEALLKENINWMAFAGTLLGAMRSKGTIPWDNDIDMMLEYSVYKENKEKIRGICANYGYHLIDQQEFDGSDEVKIIKIDKYYVKYENKLFRMSPVIDIMLGVKVKKDSYFLKKKMSFMNKLWFIYSNKFQTLPNKVWIGGSKNLNKNVKSIPFWYNIFPFISRIFFPKFILKKLIIKNLEKDLKRVGKKDYDKMLLNFSNASINIPIPLKNIKKTKLNDTEVFIPENWKKILDLKYKNWKELPNKEQRIVKGLLDKNLNDDLRFVPFDWKN